jgi:hypothetical protein
MLGSDGVGDIASEAELSEEPDEEQYTPRRTVTGPPH